MAMKKTVSGFGSKVVTGTEFAQLLTAYIDLFRRGELACLDQVVQSLTDTENEKAVKEAEELYEELMEKLVTLPTETAEELTDFQWTSEVLQEFQDERMSEPENIRLMEQNLMDIYREMEDSVKRERLRKSEVQETEDSVFRILLRLQYLLPENRSACLMRKYQWPNSN
ncbi:guanylate-binding protein 4-like [Stegostoma tigrinum]|uniref:guanylate-binding protein 4-like n=1 Tax=Stegostoma tigrinum TaxID=3053191 RepID=UPI00287003F2|nr:guanylate-binding protein 4-like [Stegostoma tigrinum]